MPDAFTPNLALVKPEVGASRDTWGAKTNLNWDVVDDVLAMAMPIGAILDFAGPNAPPGWLICDGRLVSRITYSALFGRIGTFWGAGDGSTNFALPPTPGRALVGPGTCYGASGDVVAYSFTQSSGSSFTHIQQTHLPNYAIGTDAQGGHNHGYYVIGDGSHVGGHYTDAQGFHNHDTAGTGYGTPIQGGHTHPGSTDTQGTHQHNVQAWGTTGGGILAVGAGVNTNGGVNTSFDGAHAHNFTTGWDGAHAHNFYWDGNHGHNILGAGAHNHAINWDGNHAHTLYLGGGGAWFDVRQATLVVTKIIFAGQQASARVLTAAAAAPTRRLSAPLRGSH